MEAYSVKGLLNHYFSDITSMSSFPLYQIKALYRLKACRSEALGGHVQRCEKGHVNGIWYNSCKHRACPQCRSMASEEWLRNTQGMLLNCAHHHIVFTIPSELHALWRYNRDEMTGLLFEAAQETIKTFAADPKHLGATPAYLSALHTWGRNLGLHPHIHLLISQGLSKEGEWVEPKRQCLFPQKPVTLVFRGKLLAKVKQALAGDMLSMPQGQDICHLKTLCNKLGRKNWMVHFCDRYDHARGVAKYLARYVKGGPFRNSQITDVSDDGVCFQYKSHTTKRIETLKLSAAEFMQRLLQHVPLPGKPTVRYGGLYSSSCRARLNQAREKFDQQAVSEREQLLWQTYIDDLGHTPKCKECGLPLIHGDAFARKKQAE